MTVYLNGKYLNAEDATISVLDRGFIFGDGVYEVWRVVDGRLFEHARHERRLKRGLQTIEIAVPDRDVEELPVVREGELIGFLTREAILRMLFGNEGSAPAES